MKKEPVVIVFTILAALQVIDAGLALSDTINKDTAAIVSLVIAALTAAASFYVRAMVTPWDQVVSKIASDGQVVAGPAGATTPPGQRPTS
jgi:hypothetical protein